MTILTAVKPSISNWITPSFTACTAADKFTGGAGTYILLYQNGATPTTQCYVTDQNVSVPPGAATPSVPTGATNWSDALISSAIGASALRIGAIDGANIQQYTDATNFVNLKHNTPTTLTVAVFGPF